MNATEAPNLRVILIEDSPMLCDMMRDMLSDLNGVEVVCDAGDEDSALEALAQFPADLVIVDLELKSGSGLGVLTQVRDQPERYGTPRRVVFSNYGHEVLRARCKALEVEHFFDKSFQMDELMDFVQAYAEARQKP